MHKQALPQMQPQNRQRNSKIASILTLLTTLSIKIEKIKEKLCGFSSKDFSPECVFEALDLTNKGYLDIYDVKEFLSNDRICDQDIIKLFIRFGAKPSEPKMTYLAYLNLLKPYFNHEMSRDLLMRDTVKKNVMGSQRQKQETVLLLLNELLLLNCVCVAEHEDIKTALMDQYMLNCLELKEILGLSEGSHLQAIFEFIDCNGDYSVDLQQVKYLLAFLRRSEYQLCEEQALSQLFIPIRLDMQEIYAKKDRGTVSEYIDREREKMHMNYDKNYIGRNDLSVTTQKMSFLNYIHPNSYEHAAPVRDTQPQPPQQRPKVESLYPAEDLIASEHVQLNMLSDRQMKKSLQQMKYTRKQQNLQPSQVAVSGVYQSQVPVRLVNSSQVPIHTPVLEQFMHESNLRVNMGDYNAKPQKNQLNMLLEESAISQISNEEAFQRIPRQTEKTSKIHYRPEVIDNRKSQHFQEQKNLHSNWRPKGMEVISSQMGGSSHSGILNQFMKGDFV